MLGAGADEDDLMLLENLGESRVLRKKAVARMDRVRAGDLASRDDRRDVEVAFACRRRPDAYALVGEA